MKRFSLFTLFFSLLLVSTSAQECVQTTINMSSYLGEGGPAYASWSLYSQNQSLVTTGMAQFSMNDPYYEHNVCLVPGCYGILISPQNIPSNPAVFVVSIVANGQTLSPANYTVLNGQVGFSFCVPPVPVCPSAISMVQYECNQFGFEIGTASPGESVEWNFGDGNS
ncbi:MAG: hypothetical protein IT223_04025, partial [Crocinitomicaceae bacterium]|nr:hypothetical protein [Crocinitomicaceae bacterium]